MLSLKASLCLFFEAVFKDSLIIFFHSVLLELFCCQQQLHKASSFRDFHNKVCMCVCAYNGCLAVMNIQLVSDSQ